ncbi:MAG: glycosyltransferase family 2 protein [Candidatus Saccharicenans sp.]|nr:glycosyltransferase family 2 protein [Candidatus Saccharicenans sp.]
MKTLISVVVPTYKEAENIPVLVEAVDRVMKEAGLDYEIIIIDDDSRDGIEESVASLRERNFPVSIKIRYGQRGLSSAVIEGLRLARGNVFVVMDADLSHPPEKIPELVRPILEGQAEFVVGSRFVKGGSVENFNLYRRLVALVARLLARPFIKIKDPGAGFFAFDSRILTAESFEKLNPVGFKIGLELIVKLDPKNVIEVPINFRPRFYGKSKLTPREQLLYLIHLKRLLHYKYRSIHQLLFFALIGATGMVVDMTTVFITYGQWRIDFRIARAIGFVVALTWNFFLNRLLTFPDSRTKNVFVQYRRFFLVSCLGGLFNWFIAVYLYSNYAFFHRNYLLSVFLGIAGGFLINFFGSRNFVFGK